MSFQIDHQLDEDLVIIELKGYLERHGGDKLKELVLSKLATGYRKFVLDLTGVQLINSQGLASLLESAGQVVEEHDGSMATFGCDKQTQAVLEMASFFYLAPEAEDLSEAKTLLD